MKKLKTTTKSLQDNKLAWIFVGFASVALSYLFISLAIDSGSYWHYGASLLLFWMGVKLFIAGIKTR